jgi:hypothetical protein
MWKCSDSQEPKETLGNEGVYLCRLSDKVSERKPTYYLHPLIEQAKTFLICEIVWLLIIQVISKIQLFYYQELQSFPTIPLCSFLCTESIEEKGIHNCRFLYPCLMVS